MTNWKTELMEALKEHGESSADIEATTLSAEEMEREFDDGYGGTEGAPFTVWTKKRVYFPWQYDGAEGVASVSRHPDGEPTYHIGG